MLDTSEQDRSLELAMRTILKLFSESKLVYRYRETMIRFDVPGRAKAIRKVRR